MRTVYKYPIPMEDTFGVFLPIGAEILAIQVQREMPVFWAEVDPGSEPERRRFRVVGTGYPLPDAEVRKYLGTFQLDDGDLVFHLFEILA
jgi:hypothetical protein